MITRKIGKYEISEQIGVGGFGAVYRGRDPFIKRTVAVKTCQLNDEEIRSRFFREAELAGNLHHRNITTIYDFGVEEGVPYIVQEFLTGEDLDKIVKRGEQLSVPRKIEILMSIADGLGYAHRQSIIHRDIKPSNIRILEDGSVKIMDFGIAKSLLSESSLTQTGITLGTSAYLAPEQIRGEGLDGRTDLFSLGILAYELLTQRKPFRGEHLSTVLYKILNDTPEPITSLAPAVPASLAEVVSHAMEKSADSRYASMEAFRQDLQTVYHELVGDSSQFRTNPNSASPLTPTRGVSAAEANPAPRTPSRGTTVAPRPPVGVTPPSGALARVRAETDDHTPTQVAIPLPPANLELVHFQEPADRTTGGHTGSGSARRRGPGWVLWAGTAAVAVLGVLFAAWKLSSHVGTARPASAPAVSGRAGSSRPAAKPVSTAPIAFPTPQLGRDAVPAVPTMVPVPAAARPEEPAPAPVPEPARPVRRFPVQFSSIPSATLFVDGKKIGPSIPARTVELPQGTHQVRFEGAGLPRYQKEFQVGSSGAAPIAYRFPIGALVIEAPAWSGATVLIDSKFHGVLSGALTVALPSGTHKVTLSRAGWNPHTEEVSIPEGEKKTWSPPAPTEHAQ